jgi:L-malate glycosyltransferase
MRVLHLLASSVFSGPAETVALLAEAQRRAGATVGVAVDSTRPGTGTEEPALPRFAARGLLDGQGLALSTHGGLLEVRHDARLLQSLALDVVHCHTSHDHFVGWLGRPKGARLVRSLHAPRSIRFGLPPYDAATVPAEGLLSRLRRVPAVVFPALVDRNLFRPSADVTAQRRALGLPHGPVVGMASTFQPSRGHATALEAFAELRRREPDATLVLLGDGILERRLRARARSLGLAGAVRFPGYQADADFVRWLQVLDEVWVLGLGNDWAGRTALQARACHVRVVAAPLGGLPRWADVVLPEVTPSALASAALGAKRRDVPLPDVDAVAEAILALYGGGKAVGA